ncbi:MAG: hypothetical protein ABIH55_01665 [Nanoarchaeota archaeon]
MRKSGKPIRFELVICRVLKIYPNSVLAKMIEYDVNGMIHVSEVAGRWVRNIREFLKENQYVVCRVMRIEGENISLSLKRVQKEQASSKMNEFKREGKAEKMLELVANKLNKTLDEAYKEVGFKLQDEIGSLSKSFEIAVKNPDLLEQKGIPKIWRDAIIEIAQKSYSEKEYEVVGKMKLICYKPDGVEVIKKVLSEVKDKEIEIRYVSAPEYTIIGHGKNVKQLQSRVEETAENIVKEINKQDGECSFEWEK